jgi:hypothetical protein
MLVCEGDDDEKEHFCISMFNSAAEKKLFFYFEEN